MSSEGKPEPLPGPAWKGLVRDYIVQLRDTLDDIEGHMATCPNDILGGNACEVMCGLSTAHRHLLYAAGHSMMVPQG